MVITFLSPYTQPTKGSNPSKTFLAVYQKDEEYFNKVNDQVIKNLES